MDITDKMYIKQPYNLDVKITNTHKHLIKAIYTLVSNQSFDSITVKNICDEAGISRSNFYNHFQDKYHLLLFYLNITHQTLRDTLSFTPTQLQFTDFLTYLQKNRDFFRSLVDFENGSELRRLLESSIREDLQDFLASKSAANHEIISKKSQELQTIFLTGGITSIIQWWVINNFPVPMTDIRTTINEFFLPYHKPTL